MPYLDAQKCNKINLQTYKFLQKSPLAWYCIKCFENIVSFGAISSEELFKTNQGSKIKLTVLTKKYALPSQYLINQFWMTLDLKQFPVNTMSAMSWYL